MSRGRWTALRNGPRPPSAARPGLVAAALAVGMSVRSAAPSPAEIIGHRRRRLLELADELGNVSEACRQMGVRRAHYYEWKRRADAYGLDALTPQPARRPVVSNKTAPQVVRELLDLAVTEPTIGCRRYAVRLVERGHVVSKSTVHEILNENGLSRPSQRVARAAALTRRSGEVQAQAKLAFRHLAPYPERARGDIREVEPPLAAHASTESPAITERHAPRAPRTMPFLVGLRDAGRSGEWRAAPFAHALAGLRRWLLPGLAMLVALAAVAAVLTPGTYTVLFVRALTIGVSFLLGTVSWTILVSVSVSLVLAAVLWRACLPLLQDWRSLGSLASDDREPGHSARLRRESRRPASALTRPQTEPMAASWSSRRRPELGDDDAYGRVRVLLVAAIAASLVWLVWQQAGPREDVLIVAVTVALATRKRELLERPSDAAARVALGSPTRYLTRRLGLTSLKRRWLEVPAGGRATIPLLVSLNVLIALALFNSANQPSGLSAVPATIAFALMSCVNLVLLNALLSSSPSASLGATRASAPSLEALETGTTPRPLREGRTHELQPHADRTVTVLGRQSARRLAGRGQRRAPTRYRSHLRRFSGKLHPATAAAAVILTAGWIAYAHPGGALLALPVLVVGLALPATIEADRHRVMTMVLAIVVAVATLDYMSWRLVVTNWQGWWLAVPLLCAEALGAIHALGFHFTVWPWPSPTLEETDDPTEQPIFIFVPTLNEGVAILRPTLEGCIAAREEFLIHHPHAQVTIVICNDGRAAGAPCWTDIELLAHELGVRCVSRSRGGGAKAGNIENARQMCRATGDALLVIFDADQVPKPAFLVKTIPAFADPAVGWVQTGQYYANLANPVSRWADDQQSMFYNLLCPGKAALNSAFICGTNVVIRAAALDEIGGFAQDSVTEDFAASIVLHPRWRSIYLTEVLATGLGPLDIPSYLKQQSRWALGTLGVFRSHWRDVLLPKRNGLRFGQRVQYLLACTHYLCGVRDLVYMVSPMLFIFTGIPAVRHATLGQYLWHFLPFAVLSVTAMWYAARGVTGLRGIIISFGTFPTLLGSLAAVILRRKVPFAVTSKERRGRRSLRYLGVYVLFLALCLVCLVWATQVKGRQGTSLFISFLWVVYSLVLLGSFLWLAYRDVRAQTAEQRSPALADAEGTRPYPSKLLERGSGLRPVWNLALAGLMASPLLLSTVLASSPILASAGAATPFVITRDRVAAPYIGVSLPPALLTSRPPVLERDLNIRFSVIGRTQDIGDRFDAVWAGKLAARGARPWVVLEFGVFGPHHTPPLAASLPAIYNGVRDREITRWAVAIRDFGGPVYLTVLLQADKNWAVSSGVANGGIPEDVARAWLHVQSLFRAAGAHNVAWLWAPADPIHDQRFAPPASTITAVVQSFVNYPGTKWGDPQEVLHRLTQRYPGKPLFIDASVAGPAAAKAAWLARLGDAIAHSPQVYAVLYHEQGPALQPTAAEAKSWSVESDSASLAAWKRIVSSLHASRRLP